jgi:hypothetical protein
VCRDSSRRLGCDQLFNVTSTWLIAVAVARRSAEQSVGEFVLLRSQPGPDALATIEPRWCEVFLVGGPVFSTLASAAMVLKSQVRTERALNSA